MEEKLIKKAFEEIKTSHPQGDACPDECDFCRFLEGSMDDEKRALMEEHLLSCPACTDYMVALHKVSHFPADEMLPVVPAAQIAKACGLIEGKNKAASKETTLIESIKEFFSFQWITRPILVMAQSCAVALVVLLVCAAAYLYVQQSAPLSAQLEVTGMSSEVIRGTAPAASRVIKEGDILYSEDYCRISFELSRDAFAYVFYYDSGGLLHQLYPDPAAVMPKKVEGGKTYNVPDTKDDCFILDDQKGTETIFMVASAKPIGNISELYQAAKGLNRDASLKLFREAAPVFKVLNFIHQ
jgi:hypothetical protein